MTAVGLDLALDLLAVGHAGGLELGLHAEAALQLGAEHVHLDIALTGDDHLVGLGVVHQREGDVFLVQTGEAGSDLVILTLGLGGDGHGVAGLGHLDGGQLLVQLGIAHGVAGLPIHLADGNDVAAAGVLDLGHGLAGGGVEAAQLIGAGGAQVAEGHVGGDVALHDLDKAVLAELVGHGLEHEALGEAVGINALSLGGIGNVIGDALQESLGADVLHGGRSEHGDHVTAGDARLDAGDHILLAQLHLLEELLHQLFGGAGGGLHQLHAQVFHMAGVGSGNSGLAGLAALGDVSHVLHQVDDAGAVGAGDGDGGDDAAVLLAQRVHHGKEVAVLLIGLGDDEQGGQVRGLGGLPHTLGADGDAVLGGDQDGAGFHRAQGAQGLAHKVKVARAVQDVDLLAAEADGGDGGGDGDLALDLFGVVVAGGVAVGDLALAISGAGYKEHALGQTGLAAVAVAQEGDVANVFRFHVLLPL